MDELRIFAGWVTVLDCIFDESDPDDELLDYLRQSDPERYSRMATFLLAIAEGGQCEIMEVH
jgi:hypothetical protein